MEYRLGANEKFTIKNNTGGTVSELTALQNAVVSNTSGLTVQILDKSTYDAISVKDPKTLYFITGATS